MWLVRWFSPAGQSAVFPLDIARARYAGGEISAADFNDIKLKLK
jgi:hypothetical protein